MMSDNETFNKEAKEYLDDEKEQFNIDECYAEQMEIEQNGSEKLTDKEDNFVNILGNKSSNSLMDFKNKMRTKTEHLPPYHQKCRMLSNYCHCSNCMRK